MRILPVNNYNYQTKTQNSKQQNVNFGMLHGSPEITKRFCDAAGFIRVASRLRDFVVALQRQTNCYIHVTGPIPGYGLKCRRFVADEVTRLQVLRTAADNKCLIMTPEESTRFFNEIENADPDVVKNDEFFKRIEQQIASAGEIKDEHVLELEKVEKIRQALWDKSSKVNPSVPV